MRVAIEIAAWIVAYLAVTFVLACWIGRLIKRHVR